jgi:hypothetical protein
VKVASNSINIASNTVDIYDNAANISSNAAGVSNNAAAISSNDAEISSNTVDIASNTGEISNVKVRSDIPILFCIASKYYYSDLRFFTRKFLSYTIIWAYSYIQNSIVILNELEGGNLEKYK